MLIALLYHRVNAKRYSSPYETLREHLTYLARNYPIVVPGDKIPFFKLNICISFDDAYFDFYHFVFPLLKELNIRAVLAVPTQHIQERVSMPADERLQSSDKKVALCSWEELREMVKSGLVHIASHTHTHSSLVNSDIDLKLEIEESKKTLEEKLGIKINSFAYPMGQFNTKIHKLVKNNYRYVMRIGNGCNFSWHNINDIIYRIPSDNPPSENAPLKLKKFISYFWFFFLNSIRNR